MVGNWQVIPPLTIHCNKMQTCYAKLQGEFIIHPDKKDLTPGRFPSFNHRRHRHPHPTLIHIPSEHILPTDYNRPILQ